MDLTKTTLLVIFGALAVFGVIAQEKTHTDWKTYAPSGASFTMKVPSVPLPPQGHIFDPEDNETAHKIVEYGLHSRTYNFEINKNNKRWFLVSILEVQTAKRRPHRLITDLEMKCINSIIADEITPSKVERWAIENGEVVQWSYDIAGMGDGDEGMVFVKQEGTHTIVVVVAYDFARAGDAELEGMLDSLRLRKR